MEPRLFDLDFQLLADSLLTIIAVFVLFIALSYLLFNPARKFMQDRQNKIAGELDHAQMIIEAVRKEKNYQKNYPVHYMEIASDDAWARDVGPTFVVNGQGQVRGIDWCFNAWGGICDGLYADWEKDDNENNKVKTNRKFFMNIIFRIYMIRHF